MREPLTDAQLTEWKTYTNRLYYHDSPVRLRIEVLIQEVRRLKQEQREFETEASRTAGALDERAKKAEAEVERLRGLEELGQANMNIVLAREKRLEAERDRYKGALEEIASYGPELDNTPPTPPQVALAALSQPVREEGEEE